MVKEKRWTMSFAASAGGMSIQVVDNGPGIPDAIRDSLFQPFVSHGKEKGIGLGLTVVQKIMNRAVREGEPLRLRDLERGILLVNDLPGVSAASSLSAGSVVGTCRVEIERPCAKSGVQRARGIGGERQ